MKQKATCRSEVLKSHFLIRIFMQKAQTSSQFPCFEVVKAHCSSGQYSTQKRSQTGPRDCNFKLKFRITFHRHAGSQFLNPCKPTLQFCRVRETAGEKEPCIRLVSNWVLVYENEQERGHTSHKNTQTHLRRGVRAASWLIPLSTQALKFLLQLVQQPRFLMLRL